MVNLQSFDLDTFADKRTRSDEVLKNYIAVVFQHEYDHLNGILFYDHINKDNPMYVPENSTPIKFK